MVSTFESLSSVEKGQSKLYVDRDVSIHFDYMLTILSLVKSIYDKVYYGLSHRKIIVFQRL